MKIGILTFFESDNYGTVFQAFALQHYLESLGHTPELIRIKRMVNVSSEKFKNAPVAFSVLERIHIKLSSLFHEQDEEAKKVAFQRFRDQNLYLGGKYYETDEELLSYPPKYDLYLTGGDQVWNPYHKVFSYHYMFDFLPEGSKKASYGSSFGVAEIPDRAILDKMGKLLSVYRAVSVREKSGVELLSQMGIKAERVLDPVFLIGDHWKRLAENMGPVEEKYCLVYALVDYPKEEDALIQSFAKKNGLKVIVLPANRRNHSTPYKKAFAAGPEEFIHLIAHSEYIFTNSYHGLAFSILFQKQFSLLSTLSAESASKRDRLTNILEMLSLPARPVNATPEWINYYQVSMVLESYTMASREFLNQVLNVEPNH